MVTMLKTESGLVYAIIEWEQVHKERILIKYCWIHDNYRNNGAIPSMVNMMAKDKSIHGTQFVGWERGEKHKKFRWHPLYRILRRM